MIPVTVKYKNETKSLLLKPGGALVNRLQEQGIPIRRGCGGKQQCGTCHVSIQPEETFAKLSAPNEKEHQQLQFVPNVTPTSRLACNVPVNELLNDAIITLIYPK